MLFVLFMLFVWCGVCLMSFVWFVCLFVGLYDCLLCWVVLCLWVCLPGWLHVCFVRLVVVVFVGVVFSLLCVCFCGCLRVSLPVLYFDVG